MVNIVFLKIIGTQIADGLLLIHPFSHSNSGRSAMQLTWINLGI